MPHRSSLHELARSAQVVGLAFFYPMIFLSGASIPLQVLPANLRQSARFLPLYYVVQVLQGAWTGRPLGDLVEPALFLAAMLLVSMVISVRLFRWER